MPAQTGADEWRWKASRNKKHWTVLYSRLCTAARTHRTKHRNIFEAVPNSTPLIHGIRTKTDKDEAWPSAPSAPNPVVPESQPAPGRPHRQPRNLAYFTVLTSGRVEEKPIIFVPQHETSAALTRKAERSCKRSGENSTSGLASWHRFLESSISFHYLFAWICNAKEGGQEVHDIWPVIQRHVTPELIDWAKTHLDHASDDRRRAWCAQHVSFRLVWERCYSPCARGKRRPGMPAVGGTRNPSNTGTFLWVKSSAWVRQVGSWNKCGTTYRVRVHMYSICFNMFYNAIDTFKQLTARRLCLAKLFMRTSRLENPRWLLDLGTPWCHEHITHLKGYYSPLLLDY